MTAGDPFAPGAIFAEDYRIVRPLAAGGMGAVYVAEQLSTGKQRAVKVMKAELLSDDRLRQRFVQEARIGSMIRSDHVVEVIGAGIDAATQTPWMAMELLDGCDLRHFVAHRRAVSPAEAILLLRQISHALGAAHQAGIVHRDLKPENIFVATSHQVGVAFVIKLLDFGVAKVVAEAQANTTATASVGTPRWMAPEQTEASAEIGPPTDVWALGLIVFFMLTGHYFWSRCTGPEASVAGLMREILVDPIPTPSTRAAALGLGHLLPPGFDQWFAHTVTRDVRSRYADAPAAIAALEPLLSGTSRAPSVAGASRPGGTAAMAATGDTGRSPSGHGSAVSAMSSGSASPVAVSLSMSAPQGAAQHHAAQQGGISAGYPGMLTGPGNATGPGVATTNPGAAANAARRQKSAMWIWASVLGLLLGGVGIVFVFREDLGLTESASEDEKSDDEESDDEDDHKKAHSKKKKKKVEDSDALAKDKDFAEQIVPDSPVKLDRDFPTGAYTIKKGVATDGQTYEGTVNFQRMGNVYNVQWINDEAVTVGLALVTDDVVAVAFGACGTQYGIALYDKDGGELDGLVTGNLYVSQFIDQKWKGSPKMSGDYSVTSSMDVTGMGVGNLAKRSGGFNASVRVPTGSYEGVAMQTDGYMAFAWTTLQSHVGVAIYERKKNGRLEGRYIHGHDAKGIGEEILLPPD